MRPLIVIPARLSASRLPNKPLGMIGDFPMIIHCLHRALEADVGAVLVAAGDPEIVEQVRQAGGEVLLTDPDLPSGSDRVMAGLAAFDPDGQYDVIINFQGDLPFFDPQDFRLLLQDYDPEATGAVRTLLTPITDPDELASPNVVKVQAGFVHERPGSIARALCFSRAAVPWGQGVCWHHIGVYGYPRRVLERFVTLPPGVLEQRERLEQLRLLENGYTIEAVIATSAAFGIDTPADLERARKLCIK